MVVSLFKLAEEGKIEKTGAKPKLPIKIDGVNSRILDVYKIPLKYLFYNEKMEEFHRVFRNMNLQSIQYQTWLIRSIII